MTTATSRLSARYRRLIAHTVPKTARVEFDGWWHYWRSQWKAWLIQPLCALIGVWMLIRPTSWLSLVIGAVLVGICLSGLFLMPWLAWTRWVRPGMERREQERVRLRGKLRHLDATIAELNDSEAPNDLVDMYRLERERTAIYLKELSETTMPMRAILQKAGLI